MGSILNDVDRSKEKNSFLSLSSLLCCVSKNSIESNTLQSQQSVMENEGTEMLEDGLETDAVPVKSQVDVDEEDQTRPTPNISTEMERINNTQSQHLEPGIKVMKNHTSSMTTTELVERRSSPTSLMPQTMSTTNVANTQGAVVMQFSNIQGLHIGAVNNINLQHQPGQQSNRNDELRKTRRTRTIENMMHSLEDVDEKMLTTVSANLGEGWQFVMRELGLTDPLIDQANMDYSMYGVKEVGVSVVDLKILIHGLHSNLGDLPTVIRLEEECR